MSRISQSTYPTHIALRGYQRGNCNDESPLDLACRNGEQEVVSFLANRMGLTSPEEASQNKRSDIVRPSPEGRNTGTSEKTVDEGDEMSLHIASERGRLGRHTIVTRSRGGCQYSKHAA